MAPPDPKPAVLRAIAERHGFDGAPILWLPTLGVVNTVYLLGDSLILRVPKNLPDHIGEAHTEALVVPVARQAGVTTPAIIACDDTLELLPVPYAIYERVAGVTLASLNLAPRETAGAYHALGGDLARLHLRDLPAPDPLAAPPPDGLPRDEPSDPRGKLEQLEREGYLWGDVARWLLDWLERLAPEALVPVPQVVCHNDAWPGNVFVQPESHAYVALLDWGDAIWSDPTTEFANLPPRALPFALAGYRAVAGDRVAGVTEARILWRHIDWSLHAALRSPQPERRDWSGAPLNRMLELMRFFLESPEPPWSSLGP